MKGKARDFASVPFIMLILALQCTAQDNLNKVARQHKPHTINVALKFTKRDQHFLLRALSVLTEVNINGRATGFLVGDGLVMTSYHVVSGDLSGDKKRLLGFKPDDRLQVEAYINGCQARVVKVDKEADLALLRICTSKPAQRPIFRTTPSQDEQLLVIAQPGDEKMLRRGSFNGLSTFRGSEYWAAKVDAQDGFSGSPVYDSNGEIVGVFCLYDWKQRVALLSPGVKAQQFLTEYAASLSNP